MLSANEFSFREIADRKTAVFVTVSDTDRSMDVLVNLFFTQAMNELCYYADTECDDSRLPVPVSVMYDWMITGVNGAVERKTITITLLDEEESPAASWQVINAWPMKYTAPDFNATASEVAIETVEIAHEGMTRIS